MQIPNVLRAENKSSMGAAPATKGPFNGCASCHTKAPRAACSSPHGGETFTAEVTGTIVQTSFCGDCLSDDGSHREATAGGSLPGWLRCLCEASVHGGMWLGLGNFTGLTSFQRLRGRSLGESLKLQQRSSEHSGPMVSRSRYVELFSASLN